MKKMILATVLLVTSFYTTVQAGIGDKPSGTVKTVNVSRHVLESFNKKFPQAQYAVWQLMNEHDIYLVRFVYNEQGIVAYVDQQGSIIATARTIQRENLPSTVNQVLEAKYADAQLTESLELVLDGELNYLITLKDTKATVTLKISANGDFKEVKKQKFAK